LFATHCLLFHIVGLLAHLESFQIHYPTILVSLTFDLFKPFTNGFPRADINELLSPDLLHQLIKGTFKDHLVTWVNIYIKAEYPESEAQKILDDIDRQYSVFSAYTM
jgi:hypothetical protein